LLPKGARRRRLPVFTLPLIRSSGHLTGNDFGSRRWSHRKAPIRCGRLLSTALRFAAYYPRNNVDHTRRAAPGWLVANTLRSLPESIFVRVLLWTRER